jgi:TolA-binding protein
MTRLFLAAGVAALAIAAPAAAKPGGGHGGGNQVQAVPHGGGGGGPRGGGGSAAFRGGGGGHGGGFAAPRMQRQSFAQPRIERAQRFAQPRVQRAERQQLRANRVQQANNRAVERQQLRANRVQQVQNRAAERQQLRMNRNQQVQTRMAERQQLQANRMAERQNMVAQRQQLRADRQANQQQLMAQRQEMRAMRVANADAFRQSRLAAMTSFTPRTRVIAPAEAVRFVGQPVSTITTLAAVPPAISYLYPDTPDYYYRYGDGYLYEVNRSDNLIAALFPLLAGGFMPGSYLPNYYMSSPYYGMNSYFPAAYGFNSFYPDYGDDCYRYGYGVVYEVDCFSGFVEDVIPLYAGGYGVGQMLPSAYSYYNVPMQYRPLYYDTADYGYWYAPGAIYQYDRGSSMITSVAALMSPGFTIGQPLPMGYSVYNVPYGYRATYYDTPSAWYRYNNGYIYQVDPATMLVTAIVASALT